MARKVSDLDITKFEQRPGESLQSYYRRIAKVADQRLVRLERLAEQEGYKNADQWAYKKAMRDISTWSGEDGTRFNTKPPENIRQLQAKINDIKSFLGSPSSTKAGIKRVYQTRANSINANYGTKFTTADLEDLFSSSLWKKVDAKKYDSDTVMKAIGYIGHTIEADPAHRDADEVLKGLQATARKRKEVPEFTGDVFLDSVVTDILRSKKTVNEMYQYFKSI